MSSIVLDTSAVLALLFGEPGADKVKARGQDGIMSTVSYSEAVAKSLDRKVPMETIARSLAGLKLTLVPFDEDHALTAAALRPSTRHLDFSFADRACLATASMHKLPVLTADRDWFKADLGIKVYLIR
ncbi:MAG TPA: type II toxin-antitoxin system VapC family toxin [Gemmataceae bacterium]|nr:type II toxin-antitoxin system VapC family toxin [Gemmataceae bacterium]